jgi:hypothetical protein
MGSVPVITSEFVQETLDVIGSWSAARLGQETLRFTQSQPAVATYLLAMLEDHAVATTSFALQMAQVVERVYRRATHGLPLRIGERDMEIAANEMYERFSQLASTEPELASEMQTGRPIPKIGRNEPCLCGSGRKFKKCCAQMHEPPPLPPKSHAEQLFGTYIHSMELVWTFLHEAKRDRDARWVRKRYEEFEERFFPGVPGGVPDSMHVSYTLFDLRVPRCGKTMGELFLEREGHRLPDAERRLVRDLCGSYCGFYELIETLPTCGKKRLRELLSGTEWLVSEIDDPHAEEGEPGEIWLCRFAGALEDAVAFMTPLIYPPDTRDQHERLIRACIAEHTDRGMPVAEAIRAAMKHEMEVLAQYVIATAPEIADADDGEETWVEAE